MFDKKVWYVEHEKGSKVKVDSEQGLISALQCIEASWRNKHKPMAIICAPSGETMVVGLGETGWYLNCIAKEGIPSYSSINPEVNEDKTIVFQFVGEYSEIDAKCLIPKNVASNALRYWYKYGSRFEGVTWIAD